MLIIFPGFESGTSSAYSHHAPILFPVLGNIPGMLTWIVDVSLTVVNTYQILLRLNASFQEAS